MREINRKSPDIIHLQGTHPLYCLTAILSQRRYPTIITVHGIMAVEMEFHLKRNFLLRFLSKFIEKKTLSMIRNIIVVAPQIGEIIHEMNGINTFMIPNGVNVNLIKKIEPAKFDKDNIIFFIGNFNERKGIDILIRAFNEVKKSISDSNLFIAGSGEEESNLKNLVKKLDLESDIKFLGFVKGDKKFSLIKSANILVLPSVWESLPIAVLEGMACGKPIIASNVGGIPYLVDEGVNGFLVRPGEVKELSDKIIKVLKNKKLQKSMGKASLKMSEDFEWSKIAEKTYKVYKEIVEEYKGI